MSRYHKYRSTSAKDVMAPRYSVEMKTFLCKQLPDLRKCNIVGALLNFIQKLFRLRHMWELTISNEISPSARCT